MLENKILDVLDTIANSEPNIENKIIEHCDDFITNMQNKHLVATLELKYCNVLNFINNVANSFKYDKPYYLVAINMKKELIKM